MEYLSFSTRQQTKTTYTKTNRNVVRTFDLNLNSRARRVIFRKQFFIDWLLSINFTSTFSNHGYGSSDSGDSSVYITVSKFTKGNQHRRYYVFIDFGIDQDATRLERAPQIRIVSEMRLRNDFGSE